MRKLYALLLNFYPNTFREEYADELQTVFDLSLIDAKEIGTLAVVRLVFQEIIALPRAILYEHLRERRKTKMTGNFSSRFDFEPGSGKEVLATLLPFLLFSMVSMTLGFIGKMVDIPNWLEGVIALLLLGTLIGVFVVGFIKAVPRWFMPYLGFPLSIINLILFNALMYPSWRGFPGLMQAPAYIKQFVNQGLLWSGLILLILLLVMVSAFIPRFRPFYQRLREDWTLLAFILYGTTPFSIILAFDDYQNEDIYKILSFLVIAVGAWFYLRNKSSWKRFWSLFIGLALSMFVTTIGKGILYAGPWPRPKYFTWQGEMVSTIIMWIWLALVISIPLALNLLPPFERTSKTT